MSLATNGFNYQNQLLIMSYFQKTFGIESTLVMHRSGTYCLRFNKTNSHIFAKIISPFVIEDMKYKIEGFAI